MINVNTVYQTVLTLLNKEQRGYLDSEEFNDIARVVQREIVESYFNQSLAAPEQGMVVANPSMFIDEKISYFEKEETITERNEDSFFEWPDDFMRLGIVTTDGVVIDQVSHKDARYINRSPLTKPSAKQPVYVVREGGIQVYPDAPDSIAISEIDMVYIKEPTDPVWGFNQTIFDDDAEVVYDNEASTDFELHPSELQELVIRICAYAGLTVRAPEVTQFAQQGEQKIQATEQ